MRWVEMFPMENMKLRQGGWKERIQNVMAMEDHTPCWRRLVCSSERLEIRKTVR